MVSGKASGSEAYSETSGDRLNMRGKVIKACSLGSSVNSGSIN